MSSVQAFSLLQIGVVPENEIYSDEDLKNREGVKIELIEDADLKQISDHMIVRRFPLAGHWSCSG